MNSASSSRPPTAAEAAFARFFAARSKDKRTELSELRASAFDTFLSKGLPNRREEAWKYTDLRALLREAAPLGPPPDGKAKQAAKEKGLVGDRNFRRLLFVGGYFVPELSDLCALESGLTVRPLSSALASGDPLTIQQLAKPQRLGDSAVALNTAFVNEGVVIHVAANTSLIRPLHLVFVSAGEAAASHFLRTLVVLDAGAQATLVETHEGGRDCAYYTNIMTEIMLAERAKLERVRILRESPKSTHVATLLATLAGETSLMDVTLTIEGALVRNQSFVELNGRGASVNLRGAKALRGAEHVDTSVTLMHKAEHTESRTLFKSVLDDNSQSIFQGKIVVDREAQRTDARMMARALLLSERAQANSKPELEIFADDVQCAHGSTVGALDPDLKFYLMARGIPEGEAERLLVESFLAEALESIKSESVREALVECLGERLRGRI